MKQIVVACAGKSDCPVAIENSKLEQKRFYPLSSGKSLYMKRQLGLELVPEVLLMVVEEVLQIQEARGDG